MDLVSEIKNSSMSRFQVVTVFICLVVVIIDGFDISAMTLAARYISEDWTIAPSNVGYMISAATAGMAVGSLLLGPLGDRMGRKLICLISLCIVSAGMVFSTFAGDLTQLLVSRVLTGIGLGGVLTVVGVIISEYSSRRRTGLTMSLFAAASGAGAVLGGVLAGFLIPAFGWRSIFAFGAGITALIAVVALFALPESLEFLLVKRTGTSLRNTNRILVRMGRSELAALPPAATRGPGKESSRLHLLFGRRALVRTVVLILAYGALMATFYFVMGWTPNLVSAATGRNEVGLQVGVYLPLGGIIGCIGFGALSIWLTNRALTITVLVASGVCAWALAHSLSQATGAFVIAVVLGICLNASVTGFYAMIPSMYPADARASGFGVIIGFGRIAAVVSPIVAGYMLDGAWRPQQVYQLFGMLTVVSALCVAVTIVLARRQDKRLVAEVVEPAVGLQ